jgi:acyl dehydratase
MTEWAVGECRESVVCPEITRTQIVQYAGATGDFSPLHCDEPAAVRAGYPGVLAHGMMVMAASARPLVDWVGVERLSSYSARFLRPTWPGDTLTTSVTVEAVCGERVDFRISTTNQDGVEVLAGQASARGQEVSYPEISRTEIGES